MWTWLHAVAGSLRRELGVYPLLRAHPRAARRAHWLPLVAIGYMPLASDPIPDFIPVVGHLHDPLPIPPLVMIARWLIPPDVMVERRSGRAVSPLLRLRMPAGRVGLAPDPAHPADELRGRRQPGR